MLSAAEYANTQSQLDNLPSELTAKQRNNLRRRLTKKLKEHDYAVQYTPFVPLPYIPYFINHTTSEPILRHLIQTATTSAEFTLDTESFRVYQQPNRPALIQLQIILPRHLSLVILVEMCHLPQAHQPSYRLIQDLFRVVFTPEKIIYLWGSTDEFIPFVIFNLFSLEQIANLTPINLQNEFKLYWNCLHPHQSRSSTSSLESPPKCLCETCIGKRPSESWSLQDSVAYELDEYLSKVFTDQNFSIGLDPRLFRLTVTEQQHRQQLTTYALHDCLSMQRLIIRMKNRRFNFHSHLIDSPLAHLISPSLLHFNHNTLPSASVPHQPSPQLTADERRIIHNRSCTLKQRKRLYTHVIIRRNIDPRFRITDIKNILKSHAVGYTAVNSSTSSLTEKRSLYIGITDGNQLPRFERVTRHLFTSAHYDAYQHAPHLSSRRSRRSYRR